MGENKIAETHIFRIKNIEEPPPEIENDLKTSCKNQYKWRKSGRTVFLHYPYVGAPLYFAFNSLIAIGFQDNDDFAYQSVMKFTNCFVKIEGDLPQGLFVTNFPISKICMNHVPKEDIPVSGLAGVPSKAGRYTNTFILTSGKNNFKTQHIFIIKE